MIVRNALSIAAVLLGLIGAAPAASAEPGNEQPGAQCDGPGATSADGTLTCSGQASIWMHRGMPIAQPGQPCTRAGDVTYAPKEQVVHCQPSGGGLAWQ